MIVYADGRAKNTPNISLAEGYNTSLKLFWVGL